MTLSLVKILHNLPYFGIRKLSKVFLEQINRQEMKNEKKRLQRIVSQILKHFDRNSHQLL